MKPFCSKMILLKVPLSSSLRRFLRVRKHTKRRSQNGCRSKLSKRANVRSRPWCPRSGLLVSIPAGYADRTRLRPPIVLNAPDVWWIQGDGGLGATRAGRWIRVFGKCLNLSGASRVCLASSLGKEIVLELTASSYAMVSVTIGSSTNEQARERCSKPQQRLANVSFCDEVASSPVCEYQPSQGRNAPNLNRSRCD